MASHQPNTYISMGPMPKRFIGFRTVGLFLKDFDNLILVQRELILALAGKVIEGFVSIFFSGWWSGWWWRRRRRRCSID